MLLSYKCYINCSWKKKPIVRNLGNKNNEIEKKLTDHGHDKYITTSEFNNLAAADFDASLNKSDLVRKTDFDDKLKSLNHKINSMKQSIYWSKMS